TSIRASRRLRLTSRKSRRRQTITSGRYSGVATRDRSQRPISLIKVRWERGMIMAQIDWSQCPLVEVIPGKVSGAPLLKNTRLPVEAITGNYDAFLDEGLSPEAAITETLDCYPQISVDVIKSLLQYRATHEFQAQH